MNESETQLPPRTGSGQEQEGNNLERAELIDLLRVYIKGMDAVYNHNEAARAAVTQHFGTVHPYNVWKFVEDVIAENRQEQDELLPCPFCGNKSVGVVRFGYRPQIFGVTCDKCGAEGGREGLESDAKASWNRRLSGNAAMPTRASGVERKQEMERETPTAHRTSTH